MCIFDGENKVKPKDLLKFGFKAKKSDPHINESKYYSFDNGTVNYFPKNYKGNTKVYGKTPNDLIVGFDNNGVNIIKNPDICDIRVVCELAKSLIF